MADNIRALIIQAAKQCIYGENGLKKYFIKISNDISSKKMDDICNEIYSNYLLFKKNKTQFNELSLFLNLEVEKLIKN